jgi:hypothetical protein
MIQDRQTVVKVVPEYRAQGVPRKTLCQGILEQFLGAQIYILVD